MAESCGPAPLTLRGISQLAKKFVPCHQCNGEGVDAGGIFSGSDELVTCIACTGAGCTHDNGSVLTDEEIILYRSWQVREARRHIRSRNNQIVDLRKRLNEIRQFVINQARDYREAWGKREKHYEDDLPEALRTNTRGPFGASRAD